MEVRQMAPLRLLLVDDHHMADETLNAKHKATKVGKARTTRGEAKLGKSTMKWPAYLSTFVLNRMCSIINSGMTTEKGFKEVHLNGVTKKIFEYYQQEVSSTQVYNHLHKWRARWIHISNLRDLGDAGWDEDTHTIILEDDHYIGHVSVFTSHLHNHSLAQLSMSCNLPQLTNYFPHILGSHKGRRVPQQANYQLLADVTDLCLWPSHRQVCHGL
jgi:hypothetical protein